LPPPRDGRALDPRELEAIQKNIFRGCYHDHEIVRLFETIEVQRRVLRRMFNLFKSENCSRVLVADPIRNSQLVYFKELVSMEDPL
jgi:hypothetical protein